MGCFIFIDYLIGLIVLIRIHAPWWAWTLYIISVLVWLVIWVSSLYAGPVVALAPTCYVVWQNLVLSYMTAKIKPAKKAE